MIIASQKRKENIAEYLLYMWQIEDLIRANGLDIERIRQSVINNYPAEPAQLRDMAEWYESLIDMMRRISQGILRHTPLYRRTKSKGGRIACR